MPPQHSASPCAARFAAGAPVERARRPRQHTTLAGNKYTRAMNRSALVHLQARLGGALHRAAPETWAPYGSVAPYYRDKFEATEWLETAVRGRRALVLVDLRRRVGHLGVDVADDESAEPHVQQAVAVVLPEATLASPLSPVMCGRGTAPHLWLLDHPLAAFTWTLAGGETPVLSAGPFRFSGCFQGVLYAVQDGPTLDVDAAMRALEQLAQLAALPWRAPSPEAVAAWEAQQRRGARVFQYVLVALIVAIMVLGITMAFLLG